jgi:hypothetical protein
VKRPLGCSSCLFPFCLPKIEISSPSGVVGQVRQRWSPFANHLTVYARDGETICHIKRQELPLVSNRLNEFKIFDPSGKLQIGKVRRWVCNGCNVKAEMIFVSQHIVFGSL